MLQRISANARMVTSKHTCGRQSALNWFILNSVAKDGDYTLAQVCLKISTAEIRLYAIQLDSNDIVARKMPATCYLPRYSCTKVKTLSWSFSRCECISRKGGFCSQSLKNRSHLSAKTLLQRWNNRLIARATEQLIETQAVLGD